MRKNEGNKKEMQSVPVVLVVPLNQNCALPSLGVSILKESLKKKGVVSKVFYANMVFYETMGTQLSEHLLRGNLNNLIFERLFASFAHKSLNEISMKGLSGDEIPEYLSSFYKVVGGVNENISENNYIDMVKRCEIFLKKAVKKIASFQPKIVGFSNYYQQINVSIALARDIKELLPNAVYVIGGSNCEGEIGEELAASVELLDFVFQGEADLVFADFCYNYLTKNILPRKKLIQCPKPDNLDLLPIPDFTDFFEQCVLQSKSTIVPFESSRGCWWGQKKQCKFCGEIISGSSYRVKSPERMVRELLHLKQKYPNVNYYFATDSIFPKSYYKNFLPKLAGSSFNGEITYHTKANLAHEQIVQMKQAGINRIYPGIESVSSRLLRMINKGTSAMGNIRLLRDCRECNIAVVWSLLVGIPGDRAFDYEEQGQLIPFIQHLSPPGIVPIRIQRFSPYFENAKAHGLTEITPLRGYKYAFPGSVDITRLACFFDAVYPSESRDQPEILVPLKKELERWRERWMRDDVPKLSLRRMLDDRWLVEDTRDCAQVSTQIIDEQDYSLLGRCRSGFSPERINSSGRVKRLLELGYLIEVDGKFLSIVCRHMK